jgi:hypothetical protein
MTPILIILDEWLTRPGNRFSSIPAVIGDGLIPFVCLLAAMALFYRMLRRRFSASRNETVQTVFIFLLAAFIIMTITGVWFRGVGMKLVWP